MKIKVKELRSNSECQICKTLLKSHPTLNTVILQSKNEEMYLKVQQYRKITGKKICRS